VSLENLSRIGLLETHTTDARQVSRLLESVSGCIADARELSITNATRLDAAYRAITQLCTIWAKLSTRPPLMHVFGRPSSCSCMLSNGSSTTSQTLSSQDEDFHRDSGGSRREAGRTRQ
jgi:hypothetical protein